MPVVATIVPAVAPRAIIPTPVSTRMVFLSFRSLISCSLLYALVCSGMWFILRLLGRSALGVAKERDAQRLTPWTDISKYPHTDIQAVARRQSTDLISEADIQEAHRGSFALVLETAVQVCEARPRQPGLREETDSLERLLKIIRAGYNRMHEMVDLGQGDIVATEVAAALGRRQIKPSAEQTTDESLRAWAEQQFNAAGRGIQRRLSVLDAYHNS